MVCCAKEMTCSGERMEYGEKRMAYGGKRMAYGAKRMVYRCTVQKGIRLLLNYMCPHLMFVIQTHSLCGMKWLRADCIEGC